MLEILLFCTGPKVFPQKCVWRNCWSSPQCLLSAFQTEIVVCLLSSSFWLKWNDSLRCHAILAVLSFVLVIIKFSSIGIERKPFTSNSSFYHILHLRIYFIIIIIFTRDHVKSFVLAASLFRGSFDYSQKTINL